MRVGALLCLLVAISVGGYAIKDYSTNARNLILARSETPRPYSEAQINGYVERERTEAALCIIAFLLGLGSFVLFAPGNDPRQNRNSQK